MIRTCRNVLRFRHFFFFVVTTLNKWAVLYLDARSLLLHWFWTLVLLSRSHWFPLSFLCRQFSTDRCELSAFFNYVCAVLWCRIYVQRSFHQPLIISTKFICNERNFLIFFIWLFFNHFFVGVHWAFFITISQFLFNPNVHT